MGDPLADVKRKPTHCRMCAKQKNYTELLDLTADEKTYEEYLDIVAFLKLDFLDLSNESLPKTTCEKCHDTFQDAYKFFKKLKDKQQVLKDLYEADLSVSIKIEPLNIAKESSEISEPSTSTGNILNLDTDSPKKFIEPVSITHCRFCAECHIKSHLLNFSIDEKKREECKTMLSYFKREIDIADSKLPNLSCETCFNAIQKAYNYFKTVQRNQVTLNEIYNLKLEKLSAVKLEKSPDENTEDYEQTTPISLCEISVLGSESWVTYPWVCKYCQMVFSEIEEIRSHCKEYHNTCHGLFCIDCKQTFDVYKDFIVHVRGHRRVLSLYCPYCKEVFTTQAECTEHTNIHYASTQKICDRCGELFPSQNSLDYHLQLYGDKRGSSSNRSWSSYSWGCLDCPAKFPSASSLRLHTQKRHSKCFAMRCMDCPRDLKNFKLFVAHVTCKHRPYLKHYCPYCNLYCEDTESFNQHVLQHITSQQRPCNMCGQIFDDNNKLAAHKKNFPEGQKMLRAKKVVVQEDSKPKKRQRNRKKILSKEDLTCKICSKFCDNTTKFKRHVLTHDQSRRRDYGCQICGAKFLTSSTLRDHVKTHLEPTERCQVCGKMFHTRHRLKTHLVTHTEDKPFICDECGTPFKTKNRLKCHLFKHSDVKPFKCSYCAKEFKFKENLKTHEYQHTGLRPYACEHCERTFTNWANCNKHMIRKHGIRLARTKITKHGRLEIDRRTGEANAIATDLNTRDWMIEMMKPEKPGKRSSRAYLKKSAVKMT